MHYLNLSERYNSYFSRFSSKNERKKTNELIKNSKISEPNEKVNESKNIYKYKKHKKINGKYLNFIHNKLVKEHFYVTPFV